MFTARIWRCFPRTVSLEPPEQKLSHLIVVSAAESELVEQGTHHIFLIRDRLVWLSSHPQYFARVGHERGTQLSQRGDLLERWEVVPRSKANLAFF